MTDPGFSLEHLPIVMERYSMQYPLRLNSTLFMVVDKPPAGEKCLPNITLYVATDYDCAKNLDATAQQLGTKVTYQKLPKAAVPDANKAVNAPEVLTFALPSAATPQEQLIAVEKIIAAIGNALNYRIPVGKFGDALHQIHTEIDTAQGLHTARHGVRTGATMRFPG